MQAHKQKSAHFVDSRQTQATGHQIDIRRRGRNAIAIREEEISSHVLVPIKRRCVIDCTDGKNGDHIRPFGCGVALVEQEDLFGNLLDRKISIDCNNDS
jgi:hypothetical protein